MRFFYVLALTVFAFSSIAAAEVRLNAATIPNFRAVEEGGTVTFFSTVINAGDETATNCRVSALDANHFGTNMDYQRTDAQNLPIGTVNTPFDIPSGGSQSLVLAIRPSGTVGTNIVTATYILNFICDQAETLGREGISAPTISVRPADGAFADTIMVLVTPSGDGIARMVENGRRAVAAGSAINIGAPAAVRFVPEYPRNTNLLFESDIHLRGMTICFTNPQGQCLAPATSRITDSNFETGEIQTFTVFLDDQADTIIPLYPDLTRVYVEAEHVTLLGDSGRTSVAVTDGLDRIDIAAPPAIHSWRFFYIREESGNFIAYKMRLTSDGYFFAMGQNRFTVDGTHESTGFLFGQVGVNQNGHQLELTGTVDQFVHGAVTRTVDVSGLDLTLGGRLRGGIPDLDMASVRGFYAATHTSPEMQPARDNGPQTDNWRLTVHGFSPDTFVGEAPLADDEFRFNGTLVMRGTTQCQSDFALSPNTNANQEQTGSYSVSGSIDCGGANTEYNGNYDGVALIEAVGSGGACYLLLMARNTQTDRVVPMTLERRGAPCTASSTFR